MLTHRRARGDGHPAVMLRLLLLRFLPRRLVPLIVIWELVQVVRRLRAGRPSVADDRVIEGRATRVPPRALEPPR
jgi:hypothetical protein